MRYTFIMEGMHQNLDSLWKEIALKIDSAISKAVPVDQYNTQSCTPENLAQATVVFKDLVSFDYALEVLYRTGVDREYLLETLKHENAHANKADQLGARHEDYKLVFLKDENGKIFFAPSAGIYIPEEDEGWSKEKQKEVLREVLEAPDIYGDSLSPGDERDLRNLDGILGNK